MADLLAAALDYADAGVYVFPARVSVVEGRKQVSPVARWRESSSTAAETLREWFAPGQPWADASLCIDCGRSALVVIDLDVTGGHDGVTAWGALMAEHSLEPTPIRVRTPSGGEHWFYAEHPRRVVGIDSSGKVAPGVDVRGLGGFVIAWPSEDARGPYAVVGMGDYPAGLETVPRVPDLVIERMNRRDAKLDAKSDAKSSVWDSMPRQFTRDEAVEFCRPIFRALRSAQVGEINHRLNDAAITIGHFVPGVWSRDEATRILIDALADTAYDGRTWHAEATIASGLGADTWRAEIVETAQRGVQRADGASGEVPLRRGDFTGVRGRERARPVYLTRDDGKALLYPGKDSYLYAETESGKSWLAAVAVVQCVSAGVPILVVDFEEGDELEYGQRLLALGLDEAQLCDASLFRYLMIDGRATGEILAEAEAMGARVVINEGMSVAYDVYGLQVKENDSATYFRRTLVKPHLVAGRAVLTTDHVVKDRDSRGRYAIGGVMKLNAASGGAFLLVNLEGLAPGRRGASALYVTKDRPGGVKQHGVSAGDKFDPQVRRFGTLVVDDTRETHSYLDVRIVPPAVGEIEAVAVSPLTAKINDAVERIKATGRMVSIRALRAAVGGNGLAVDLEVERMLIRGELSEHRGARNARVFDRVQTIMEEE